MTGATVRGAMQQQPGDLLPPKAVALPVSMDFLGRPFSEPLLLRIAAAYEAVTHHRRPPKDFGPLPGEPRVSVLTVHSSQHQSQLKDALFRPLRPA